MEQASHAPEPRRLGLWIVLAFLVLDGAVVLGLQLDTHSKVSANVAIAASLVGAVALARRRSYEHAKLWVTLVMFALLELWCVQAPMRPLPVASALLVLLLGQLGALLLFRGRARPPSPLGKQMLHALTYWLPPFYSMVLMTGAYVRYMRLN